MRHHSRMDERECWMGEVLDSRQAAPLSNRNKDWTSAALAGAAFLIWTLVTFTAMKVVELLFVAPPA